MPPRTRLGLVLSAGGLRGAAHLGVIRALVTHDIPIAVIVGASVGAIVGGYYAAVGLTIEQMVADARRFRGRHLMAHSLGVRAWTGLRPVFRPWSGIIPERLDQLRTGRFDRLHHGVDALGIVCHDLTNDRPRYLSAADHGGVTLADAVITSAAIPSLFPARRLVDGGRPGLFTDGGVSDPLPVDFARQPGLDATHVVVSDCRQRGRAAPAGGGDDRAIYIRPDLPDTTTLRAPRQTLLRAVAAGAAAVTPSVLARVRSWLADPVLADGAPAPPRGSF